MEGLERLRTVLGLTGLKAGGKGTFTKLAQSRGFFATGFGDACRREAARRGLVKPTTQQLQDIGNWGRNISRDYWLKQLMLMAVESGKDELVLDGIRNPSEIEDIRALVGGHFTLVGIIADDEVRYRRFCLRMQDGDQPTREVFFAMDRRDRGEGEPDNGQQVDRCLAMVEPANLFDNSGEPEIFSAWSEEFLVRVRAKATIG